jgi:hypothetical protein
MGEMLYPKEPRRRRDKSGRRYRVDYDLAYDGGGSEWSGYYRTHLGARIAAFYNYHLASYGGRAALYKQW